MFIEISGFRYPLETLIQNLGEWVNSVGLDKWNYKHYNLNRLFDFIYKLKLKPKQMFTYNKFYFSIGLLIMCRISK